MAVLGRLAAAQVVDGAPRLIGGATGLWPRAPSAGAPWARPMAPPAAGAPFSLTGEDPGLQLGRRGLADQHLAGVGGTFHRRRLGGWGSGDHQLAVAVAHQVEVEPAAVHPGWEPRGGSDPPRCSRCPGGAWPSRSARSARAARAADPGSSNKRSAASPPHLSIFRVLVGDLEQLSEGGAHHVGDLFGPRLAPDGQRSGQCGEPRDVHEGQGPFDGSHPAAGSSASHAMASRET